jgi:hypothetical protein
VSASCPVARAAILFAVTSLLGAAACAKPTEVELRLYPCMVAESGPPRRVDLEIVGYDEAGEPMPPLMQGFDIPDLSVLADGHATVGLRKPAGMVEAEFKLTWSYGPERTATVELPRRPVPAAGEVLELGAEGCMSAGDTTGTSAGESDASSGSTGSSSGSSSSGEGTSTSTSTGDTSTGTSTGDTSTSSSSGESSSSGGSSTTGEPSMEGLPCVNDGELFCENAGPGKMGKALYCDADAGLWIAADLVDACEPLAIFCPTDQLTNPKPIGCVSNGFDGFSCACSDDPGQPCEPDKIGCVGNDRITLCTDLGDGEIRVKGLCVGLCQDEGEGPYCLPP